MTTNDVSDTRISTELLVSDLRDVISWLLNSRIVGYELKAVHAAELIKRAVDELSRHPQPVNEPGEGEDQPLGSMYSVSTPITINSRAASIPKVEPGVKERLIAALERVKYVPGDHPVLPVKYVSFHEEIASIASSLDVSPSTSEGEAACWQRRIKYPSEPGVTPLWEYCSALEATNQFERSPHHEYRPLYAAPQPTPVAPVPVTITDEMVERLVEFATDVGRYSPDIIPMRESAPLFGGMRDDTDGAWLSRIGTVRRIRSFFSALSAKPGEEG